LEFWEFRGQQGVGDRSHRGRRVLVDQLVKGRPVEDGPNIHAHSVVLLGVVAQRVVQVLEDQRPLGGGEVLLQSVRHRWV
jgi:hypothetical protein